MLNAAELRLRRPITLFDLADAMRQVSEKRFQGFLRVSEAGEGRFVCSFPRMDGPDTAVFALVRETPSSLYAEREPTYLGGWAFDVAINELAFHLSAMMLDDARSGLRRAARVPSPTFADWLLDQRTLGETPAKAFQSQAHLIPIGLRGVVEFEERRPVELSAVSWQLESL